MAELPQSALSDFQEADLFQNGVVLEHQLPLTSKRLDCLLTGRDKASTAQAVIVELKQWEQCEAGAGRNEVTTWLGGGLRDVLHPSVQVGQYKSYLQDAHTAFNDEDGIGLNACSYLHNYGYDPSDVIFADKFKDALETHPIFTADDVDPLISFLRTRVEAGDNGDVLRAVEQSRYRPSRKLLEHVGETIKGKSEYVLLDEALMCSTAWNAVARDEQPLDTLFYTPSVVNSPGRIDADLRSARGTLLGISSRPLRAEAREVLDNLRKRDEEWRREHGENLGLRCPPFEPKYFDVFQEYEARKQAVLDPTTLILIDEADRLGIQP